MPVAVSSRKTEILAHEPEAYFTNTALHPGLHPGLEGIHILGRGWFFQQAPIPMPMLPAVGMAEEHSAYKLPCTIHGGLPHISTFFFLSLQ